MRCLSCHYELKNLPENRCPECGRAFDPNDQTSFLTPQQERHIAGKKFWAWAVFPYLALIYVFANFTSGPWGAVGVYVMTAAYIFALFEIGSRLERAR